MTIEDTTVLPQQLNNNNTLNEEVTYYPESGILLSDISHYANIDVEYSAELPSVENFGNILIEECFEKLATMSSTHSIFFNSENDIFATINPAATQDSMSCVIKKDFSESESGLKLAKYYIKELAFLFIFRLGFMMENAPSGSSVLLSHLEFKFVQCTYEQDEYIGVFSYYRTIMPFDIIESEQVY